MASYGRQAAETYVKECSDGVYNYLKKGYILWQKGTWLCQVPLVLLDCFYFK